MYNSHIVVGETNQTFFDMHVDKVAVIGMYFANIDSAGINKIAACAVLSL